MKHFSKFGSLKSKIDIAVGIAASLMIAIDTVKNSISVWVIVIGLLPPPFFLSADNKFFLTLNIDYSIMYLRSYGGAFAPPALMWLVVHAFDIFPCFAISWETYRTDPPYTIHEIWSQDKTSFQGLTAATVRAFLFW